MLLSLFFSLGRLVACSQGSVPPDAWFTVSSPFFHEQESFAGNVKRIRWGEVAATAIVIATGAAVSLRTKDRTALYASLGICGIFVGGYEFMIAHPSSSDGDNDEGSGESPKLRALHYNSAR